MHALPNLSTSPPAESPVCLVISSGLANKYSCLVPAILPRNEATRHHLNLAVSFLAKAACLRVHPHHQQALGTETLRSKYILEQTPWKTPCLSVSPHFVAGHQQGAHVPLISAPHPCHALRLPRSLTSHLDIHHCVESDACLPPASPFTSQHHPNHLVSLPSFLPLLSFLILSWLTSPWDRPNHTPPPL